LVEIRTLRVVVSLMTHFEITAGGPAEVRPIAATAKAVWLISETILVFSD